MLIIVQAEGRGQRVPIQEDPGSFTHTGSYIIHSSLSVFGNFLSKKFKETRNIEKRMCSMQTLSDWETESLPKEAMLQSFSSIMFHCRAL